MSLLPVISHIEKQIDKTPKNQVYVIEIESIPFQNFSEDLRKYLESFPSLQYLSINNCALESLDNFPKISSLIRLDLISNNLHKDFSPIKSSKYLQTLNLSGNKISEFEELDSLQSMTNLFQIDVIANPITQKPNYIQEIFNRLPAIKYVDSTDRNGNLMAQANMTDTLQRVRPDLFSKGESRQNFNIFPQKTQDNQEKQKNNKKINKVIRKTNSYKEKEKKKIRISSKLDLIFPVSRIRRKLKENIQSERYSVTAAIFLTSVLQYMCAEILDVAGNTMKEIGDKRILPKHLLKGIKCDLELKEFYESVVIPETEFVSKLRL